MDFAFLKQRYDYELDYRDKLTSAVSQPAGFLTLAGGLIVVMARGFSYDDAWLTRTFLITLVLDVGAALVSVWFMASAYYYPEYRRLPYLGELVKRKDDDTLRLRLSRGMTEPAAIDRFIVTLRELVVEVCDENEAINRYRESALRRANRALLFVLMLTSILGLSYVIDQARSSFMPKHRIVLTDPPDVPEAPYKFPPAVRFDGPRFWPSRMPPGFTWRPPWWIRLLVGSPPTWTWEEELEALEKEKAAAAAKATGASSGRKDRS